MIGTNLKLLGTNQRLLNCKDQIEHFKNTFCSVLVFLFLFFWGGGGVLTVCSFCFFFYYSWLTRREFKLTLLVIANFIL